MDATATEMIDVLVRLPRATVLQFVGTARSDAVDPATRRLEQASAMLAGRRARSVAFGGLRFVEPAWDMILALYVATAEGQRTNVLKLCTASGASTTTALRLIETFEQRGYVERRPDPNDARSILIVMLPTLADALDGWLDSFGRRTLPDLG